MCCTSASPSPVPRSFVEKNGSKIFPMFAAPIPGPESCTVITMRSPRHAHRDRPAAAKPPPAIASRALRIRLISACRSCASSAAMSGSPGAMSTVTSMPRLGQLAARHVDHRRDDRADVLAIQLRPRQAREAQVGLGDLGQAVDLADDRRHQPPRLLAAIGDLVAQQLGVQPDRRQRVAHLVRRCAPPSARRWPGAPTGSGAARAPGSRRPSRRTRAPDRRSRRPT